jgi:hypothetical protein
MDMVYEVRRQFREIPGIWKELENQNMLNVYIYRAFARNDVTRNFDYYCCRNFQLYADNNRNEVIYGWSYCLGGIPCTVVLGTTLKK